MRKLVYVMIMLSLVILTACDTQNDPYQIGVIHLSLNEDTLILSVEEDHVVVSKEELLDIIKITLEPEEPYKMSVKTIVYVNGDRVDRDQIVMDGDTLTFTIPHPNPVDPNAYVDVNVTLDSDGGIWNQDLMNQMEPVHTLSITAKNDLSGDTFSLFTNDQTQLRWYYKLFLSYNEAYDAYEVVYTDYATASIINLELPAYDYIVGVHLHTLDTTTRDVIMSLSESNELPMFLRFDSDPNTYTTGDLPISIWTYEQMTGPFVKVYNERVTLPVPTKENFTFLGWSDGTTIHHTFPRYQAKDNIKDITYTAVWGSISVLELNHYLEDLIPEMVTENITLPTSHSGYQLTWDSSDPEVISADGTYKKPYQETVITLSVVARLNETEETLTFETLAQGYKSLSGPIASSYIYRNFDQVTNQFFETLDIINGAFIHASGDGTLSGSVFLANMQTYILPKARIHGNWVIPSIAPDSAWSTIASSSVSVNNFADEIVELINTYGFDGIDIDWETPTELEKLRYTQMMKVIYEKVKANNPNHLVTTAIAGGQWQPPRYDLINSAQYVDYINMMTYGMVSSGAQYQNALHSAPTYHQTTFGLGKTLISCSIEESVNIYHQTYQVPYDKIIVGVAFYGIRQVRTYTTSWSSWQNGGSVHYTDIANTYLKSDQYTYAYDERAGVPYLYKNDGSEFISYDNRRSIIEKSEYIINLGLAGMMYWENGLDSTGGLLDAMATGLQK